MKKYWRIEEIAEQLSVSISTAYGLIARKQMGHVRVGGGRGAIRVSDDQLNDYLKGAEVIPEAPTAPTPTTRLKHIKRLPSRGDNG